MENLGDPQVGEKWRQLAQIIKDETLVKKNIIRLAVSDEHGLMTKEEKMQSGAFDQFHEVLKNGFGTGTFCREVLIRSITQNSETGKTMISFVRLDADGKPISASQEISKENFLRTYHFPLHQMGQI